MQTLYKCVNLNTNNSYLYKANTSAEDEELKLNVCINRMKSN